MSIIVAVTKNNKTVMAADTLTSFGDAQRVSGDNCPTEKIRRLGAALLGGTGWAVYDDIIENYVTENDVPNLADRQTIFTFFLGFWKALHDRYTLVNDQAQAKDSPFGDLDSSFLIANRNGIYKVSQDMSVTRFNHYYAIGWGADYALGALYNLYQDKDSAETIAQQAVRTAMEFNVHCGGEITLMDVQ